jgi:hypothetical protein
VTVGDSPLCGGEAPPYSKAIGPRPVRSQAARAYRLGDELLVYVPRSDTAHALNRSAAAIWELCDGTRTVEEISQQLADYVSRPADALVSDVKLGVEQLCKLGLLDAT